MARISKKQEEVVNVTKRGTANDFDIIIEPLITEKTMNQSQEKNKATFIVKKVPIKLLLKKQSNTFITFMLLVFKQ